MMSSRKNLIVALQRCDAGVASGLNSRRNKVSKGKNEHCPRFLAVTFNVEDESTTNNQGAIWRKSSQNPNRKSAVMVPERTLRVVLKRCDAGIQSKPTSPLNSVVRVKIEPLVAIVKVKNESIKTEEEEDPGKITKQLVSLIPSSQGDSKVDIKPLLKLVKCEKSESAADRVSVPSSKATDQQLKIHQKQKSLSEIRSKNSSSEKLYSCSICPHQTIWCCNLEKHLRVHSDDSTVDIKPLLKVVKCEKSESAADRVSGTSGSKATGQQSKVHQKQKSLSQIRSKNSSSEKPYSCSICSYQTRWCGNLKKHLRVHSGEKPYACKHCPAKFRQQQALRFHTMSHNNDRPFSCPHCPARYPARYLLQGHLKKHSGEKPFACTTCPAKFVEKRGLEEHLFTHVAEKPFECADCGARFKTRHELARRVSRHLKKTYACPYCPATFCLLNLRLQHVRKHDEKPYACAHCPARFNTYKQLWAHKLRHSDYKPHSCPQCPAAFRLRYQLKLHLAKHTGGRSYSCHQCAAKFAEVSGLRAHRRTAHSDQARFKLKGVLNKHLFVCSIEKSQACQLCQAKYKSRSALEKHAKFVHPDESVYQCAHCACRFKTKAAMSCHISRWHRKAFACN